MFSTISVSVTRPFVYSLLTILLLVLGGCTSATDPPPAPDRAVDTGTNVPTYQNLDPSVTYVGLEACAECHSAQASTYVESQMGRSFKPATKSASAADWENATPIYDPYVDFYYFPFAQGEDLFILEFRLAEGDTVYQRREKIDYIVGSGQHTNSHMMEVNGYIYQIPITWYVQEGRWDLPPGFDEGHNWRFERAIEVECMTCHNAMPEYVAGSDNRFTDLPHGINCERCHGPGSLHVAEKKAGNLVDTSKEIDPTIVNPAKLPLDLQFDVCQRCHLQGVAVPREGLSFTDFRPGMRLGDVIDVYFPRYTDSLSQFIMASHPDRIRMSGCRIPSTENPGTMDPLPCITCHDPHVPIESLGREVYNAPCVECHAGQPESSATNVGAQLHEVTCTEDLEARLAVNDDCSTCHMPVVKSIDIPHVRITDHNIRVVRTDDTQSGESSESADRDFVRLASLTSPMPSHRMLGEGYLAYYEEFNNVPRFLDSAIVQLEKARESESDLSLTRALVRMWYLDEAYDEIASFADRQNLTNVDDPWTFYRIGEAYAKLGLNQESRHYYEMAVEMAPDHLWFRTKFASAYVALGNPARALAVLDEVLNDNPKFHHAYNNRGFAHLLAGNIEQAESDFKTTLEYDPDAKQALANLASLYFNTDRADEAQPLINHLVDLEPDNEQYQQFKQAVDAAL